MGFFNILVVDLHRFHKILRNSCFAHLKLLADLLELGLLLDEHLDLLLRPPVDQKVKLVKDALREDVMKSTICCVINMPLSAKRTFALMEKKANKHILNEKKNKYVYTLGSKLEVP